MNEDGTGANSCAETVPEMELFRIQHDNLSAKIRAQEAGLKDILLHRAMTDFLHGRLDKHALYNRLAHIEARS